MALPLRWLALAAVALRSAAYQSRATSRGYRTARWAAAQPAFRFGICADIQYVASDDDYNFQKTKMRRYRQSLAIFGQAVEHWHAQEGVNLAVILGDVLDGKTSLMKNQQECLDEVMHVSSRGRGGPKQFNSDKIRYLHTLGNHDHYSYTRPDLHSLYFSSIPDTTPERFYYSVSPHASWRLISLDAYDVSLIGASSPQHKEMAASMLARKNPNDLNASGTWFENLPREDYRWVPYNGGLGSAQLAWFASELQAAKAAGQRCIVFCHQPVCAADKPQSVLWNSEEVREVMKREGNVAAWLAGHDHDGQHSFVDGIYHLVPPAPIEAPVGEKAFGVIDCYDDKLCLNWVGRTPSKPTLRPWELTAEMSLAPLPLSL